VVKTHANCTLPNPYDYELSAQGVQVLSETAWTEVQPNVIEKWVLISLAEVGDGYLKVLRPARREGVLPITVTAPAPDGVWAQAWNGTFPFTLPEGYAVASVAGTATVKDGVLNLDGRTFALPSVPPGIAGPTAAVRLFYTTKDGKPFPLLLVGEGLFWRYDPLLRPQG